MTPWVKITRHKYDPDTGESLGEETIDRPLAEVELVRYYAGLAIQGAAYSCIPDDQIDALCEKAVKIATNLACRIS